MERIGRLIVEGKTKKIYEYGDDSKSVLIENKDDITKFDDPSQTQILHGKGALVNKANALLMTEIRKRGVPVAFEKIISDTCYISDNCASDNPNDTTQKTMLPFEVVVRGSAFGSYLERNPEVVPGSVLDYPVVEFFLKTNGCKFNDLEFPCDDPYIKFNSVRKSVSIFDPHEPLELPLYVVRAMELHNHNIVRQDFADMEEYARRSFDVLRMLFGSVGAKLIDFKIEFGVNTYGKLVAADSLEQDSMRLLYKGRHLDKQAFRDCKSLDEVLEGYQIALRLIEEMTAL